MSTGPVHTRPSELTVAATEMLFPPPARLDDLVPGVVPETLQEAGHASGLGPHGSKPAGCSLSLLGTATALLPLPRCRVAADARQLAVKPQLP